VPAVAVRTLSEVPSLRDFIAAHREEIRLSCLRKAEAASPARQGPDVEADLGTVIDEIIRALGHEQGLPETSPLPGKSETAARHGRRRQELGDTIEIIVRDFGAISDAVGDLADRACLSFGAREMQVFNQCLDTAIGTAIEQYWNEARAKMEHATAERVGLLAHELRNALASARMAFSVLKRGARDIDGRTGDILARGLARLDGLIGQALLAVQLERGVAVEKHPIQASALLQQLQDSAIRERGVTLSVEVEDALEIEADERLLTSALSNLVQNAIKFTRAGGHVLMRARAVDGSGVIEVEDECGGLPPGKEEELFAPFVQKGNDRRGLGLGLSVTREAIEAHGGHLSVKNLPGKGCIFTVSVRRVARP
jgi:signal transduction histidine kinase